MGHLLGFAFVGGGVKSIEPLPQLSSLLGGRGSLGKTCGWGYSAPFSWLGRINVAG